MSDERDRTAAAGDDGDDASAGNSASTSRRELLKQLALGAASLPVAGALGARALPLAPAPEATASADGAEIAANAPRTGPRGTASDPDLLHPKKDWPRKLTAGELATLTVLCDTIIPADARSPSASAAGVPAWINEYVSHPSDGSQRDLVRVRGGLSWLDAEARSRFGRTFGKLADGERAQICDDICYLPTAKPGFRAAARFFDLVRDLSSTGFYTTDAGMKDLGYIGNVALPKFDGPPPEVLKHLGLA